ncbi:MAG: DUF4268 domain-containing protein [Thermodesulfobacteriota bacterium]
MKDFAEQIRDLATQLKNKRDYVSTEEATKTSMVMPFLQVLGYDVFEPTEVIPEYTADYHGLKKDEKIDYVLAINKEPRILIEVKNVRSILPEKSSQLIKYFHAMRKKYPVKFAILTNGIQYKFFSDFDQTNIMDEFPFLTVNIDADIRESHIIELKKFHKELFNEGIISLDAWKLKYTSVLKLYFQKQFKEPEDEFIKFLIKEAIPFKIVATKTSIEKFSPIVLDAFRQYVNEVVTDRSKALLKEATKAEAGVTNGGLSETQKLHHRFWTQLFAYSRTKTDLHSKITPGQDSWHGTGAGTGGLGYNYVIFQHKTRVELYIGKSKQDENKEIFDKLMASKAEIEQTFGGPLEWERLDGKTSCRIKKDLPQGGYRDDEQTWPKVHEAMVDAMIRLHKALSPHIQYLKK